MLDIEKKASGSKLEITLIGRLDTTSSPKLEEMIKEVLPGIELLIFDFKDLEYISSAGLRILLSAQKTMNKQGKMIVKNVSEEVNEIFEVTGFSDILTME
ncbi:MAG: STAS domain-containing protein [Clostridiales bacterium]|jgi:anti-sigma B factor antagonist|nr:STAS domain-containing protein [Clostridiales bacterium]